MMHARPYQARLHQQRFADKIPRAKLHGQPLHWQAAAPRTTEPENSAGENNTPQRREEKNER